MPEFKVDYTIDGVGFHYQVEGELAALDNRCLLEGDENLIAGCSWEKEGYTVATPWPADMQEMLYLAACQVMETALEQSSGKRISVEELEKYHLLVNDEEHLKAMAWLKQLPTIANRFFPLKIIEGHISEILGRQVTNYSHLLARFGCSVRIVRPGRQDYNPIHRDGWLDRLRNAVNIYLPLAGSDKDSSLPLIPGSHHWLESDSRRTNDGSLFNGLPYHVSSVIDSIHGLHMVRPAMKPADVMVFSPYMLHGGAVNSHADLTRVSLEMRFWKDAA